MTQVIGPDESRGHIVITRDGAVAATACDMGPHLTLWTYQGIDLSPAAARDLAQALSAWADRQHEPDDRHPDEALAEAIERTVNDPAFNAYESVLDLIDRLNCKHVWVNSYPGSGSLWRECDRCGIREVDQ